MLKSVVAILPHGPESAALTVGFFGGGEHLKSQEKLPLVHNSTSVPERKTKLRSAKGECE